ncbi:MAG: hypothetical protein KF893_02275 [Caldilineaceae bacterium]|nr:hypothetical protein [Caldilineaceae bacterium]
MKDCTVLDSGPIIAHRLWQREGRNVIPSLWADSIRPTPSLNPRCFWLCQVRLTVVNWGIYTNDSPTVASVISRATFL